MSPKKVIEQNQTVINFDIVKKKFEDSTATVEELRLAIFAPIQKFSHNSKTTLEMKEKKRIVRKTNWGTLKIEKTLLSQNHRDLLDCILTYADRIEPLDGEKTIAYKFSSYNLLKKIYGEDSKTNNTDVINRMLTDMLSSVISLETNNGDFAKFQILSFHGFLKEIDAYYIKFNPEYVRFFSNSLSINYKSSLPEILQIKEPIIRAIIRLAFTQESSLTMKIYDPNAEVGKSGILEAIGYPIESPTQKKRAFKVLKDNIDILKKYGVYYNPDEKSNHVKYKKNQNIKFIPPALHKALIEKGPGEEDAYLKLERFIGKVFVFKDENYVITEIYLDEEKNKIIVKSYLESDKNKTIKSLELPDMPTETYKFIEKNLKEG